MAFNLYRVMPDGKNLRAFWLNIEALAEGDDDDFVAVSKACPKNGGQITTGRPYSKQWSEKYTADRPPTERLTILVWNMPVNV